MVGGAQLQVVEPAVEDFAFERESAGGFDLRVLHGAREGAPLDGAEEAGEQREVVAAELAGRHAAGGEALVDQVGQLLVVARRQAAGDGRTQLAAVAIGAMAAGAAVLEQATAWVGILRQ